MINKMNLPMRLTKQEDNQKATGTMNDQITQKLSFIAKDTTELDEPLDTIRIESSTLRQDTNKTFIKASIEKSGDSFHVKRSKNKNYKDCAVRRFNFL